MSADSELPPGIVSVGARVVAMAAPPTRAKRRVRAAHSTAATNGRVEPKEVDEEAFEKLVASKVHDLKVHEEARRRLAAGRTGELALPEPGQTLVDDLDEPREAAKYAVADLHPTGGNSLLVAEKKAGKTTLALNLVQALADDDPFLGHFAIESMEGRVAFFNYEISADMFREWVEDMNLAHPERVARPLHLRGRALPFWESEALDRLATWLRGEEVEWLIVDPAARAWSGLVTNENNNTEVGAFTDALDALKQAAGIANLLLATHTGRAKREEGEEQSRGATRLEDWADSLWYLTKDRDGSRALRANGRDVDVPALDLQFMHDRRLKATGQTRTERRADEGVQSVVDAMALFEAAGEEPQTKELERAMEGDSTKRSRWIQEAVSRGLIQRQKGGRALVCSLTEEGRKLHQRRVEMR